jgi:hypothetical protein
MLSRSRKILPIRPFVRSELIGQLLHKDIFELRRTVLCLLQSNVPPLDDPHVLTGDWLTWRRYSFFIVVDIKRFTIDATFERTAFANDVKCEPLIFFMRSLVNFDDVEKRTGLLIAVHGDLRLKASWKTTILPLRFDKDTGVALFVDLGIYQ